VVSSQIAVLLILPLILWGSRVFIVGSKSNLAKTLSASSTAKTKQELAEGSQSWALHSLLIFSFVLTLVVGWSRLHAWDSLQTILNFHKWERAVFQGIILGFAFCGLLIVARLVSPEARRFRILSMSGAASPLWIRVCLLLMVVGSEELWRAVSLRALVSSGLSAPQAIVVTSVVYGLAYLPWGSSITISEGYAGAIFGAFFVWSGSILVPLTARLLIQGITLYLIAVAGPDAKPGDIQAKPYAECPACKKALGLRQVNLNFSEAFFCPSCRARITVSDQRRGFIRWGSALLFMALITAAYYLVPHNNPDLLLICFGLAFFSGLGILSVFLTLIPPRLECGDPEFISLHLSDRAEQESDEEEPTDPN
jgi:hypothetical protein